LITTPGVTLTGPAGTATEILWRLEDTDPPDWTGMVASWFLTCPGQSPAWNDYLLSIIHLRPIEGVKPAVITVPHATHEVLLFALNPGAYPTVTDPSTWARLTPHNVCEQIQLPDDEAATRLLRKCANGVLHGVLPAEPPLAGAVEPWRTVLIKTAAHLRGEPHAP